MVRLSIIVPFYNVEQYIEQCIRSLYDQDIPQEEYEVICVDDCSPDGSRGKIEELRDKNGYTNLTILRHTENKRQGGARNTGLSVAKGEYIWFVDSDDYVMPNVIGSLLDEAEAVYLDALQMNICGTDNSGREFQSKIFLPSNVMSGRVYVTENGAQRFCLIPTVWRTLFLRETILNLGIDFAENVQYEDTDWALKVFYRLNRVKMSGLVGYCSRLHVESTTQQPNNPQKMLYQVLLMARSEKYRDEVDDPAYLALIRRYVSSELSNVGRAIAEMNWMYRIQYRGMIRTIDINLLKQNTSFRNWLRIKYAMKL